MAGFEVTTEGHSLAIAGSGRSTVCAVVTVTSGIGYIEKMKVRLNFIDLGRRQVKNDIELRFSRNMHAVNRKGAQIYGPSRFLVDCRQYVFYGASGRRELRFGR
jgi:hypothetical protein